MSFCSNEEIRRQTHNLHNKNVTIILFFQDERQWRGAFQHFSQRGSRGCTGQPGGLVLCGLSPDQRLVEAIELPQHPFYVGVQFHPEFKSRPNHAHPLFREFIAAALSKK